MKLRIGALAGLLVLAASATTTFAQTLPPASDGDLLIPPDLRAGRHATPEQTPGPLPGRTAARPSPARNAQSGVAVRRHSQPEHPVDVGVVMRGGSATPKLFSPLGSTQAVRESGNAFGAGMRIGF